MITKPTVFVVGAGASCLYGMPTGLQLKTEACHLKPSYEIYHFVASALATRGQGISTKHLNDVLEALRGTTVQSIDQFLEDRQDERDIPHVEWMLLFKVAEYVKIKV